MYSTTWCGYCRRLKLQLDQAGIAYDEIDIERDPDAATFVEGVNGGNQTVPVIRFPDGPPHQPQLAEVQVDSRRRSRPDRPSDPGRRAFSRGRPRTRAWSGRCGPGRAAAAARSGAAQSPWASAARSSARVTHMASAISPSAGSSGAVGSATRVEADHQRARERPGLAAQVADVGDRDADLLVHLAGHARLQRLAGLDEPGQHREPARRPDRLRGRSSTRSRAVVHQADHRRVGARVLLVAVRLAEPVPAGVRPGASASRRGRRTGPRRASSARPTAVTNSPAPARPARSPRCAGPPGRPGPGPRRSARRCWSRRRVRGRLAAHRPVGDAVGLAEQHRPLGRGVPAGRAGAQAGTAAVDHVPAADRRPSPSHSTGVRPSASTTTSRAVGQPPQLAVEVGAQHLVAVHRGPGQHRRVEQPEVPRRRAHLRRSRPARAPRGRSRRVADHHAGERAPGRRTRSAAAATSSAVTASSRGRVARAASPRRGPSAASADSVEASPPWLSSEISSEPMA